MASTASTVRPSSPDNTDVIVFKKVTQLDKNGHEVTISNRIYLTPLDKELANTIRRADTILHEITAVSQIDMIHDRGAKIQCAICNKDWELPQLSAQDVEEQIAYMEVLPKVSS